VYQVADAKAGQRVSAVSVMDLDSLWARDEGVVATHELRVSLLVSQLAQLSICCNFLRTTYCFRCQYPPHKQLWGSCDEPCPQGEFPSSENRRRVPKPGKAKGDYVYIHMEFCEGGDMEEYMRKLPTKAFEASQLPALILQMLFSMYSSRDILGMRHYDVKLLNFLLARPEGTDDMLGKPPGFLYHFGDRQYWLPFRDNSPRIVKLADFGTAVIDRETLGTELDVDQVLFHQTNYIASWHVSLTNWCVCNSLPRSRIPLSSICCRAARQDRRTLPTRLRLAWPCCTCSLERRRTRRFCMT
jgi:serine/threonine protein kinase